MPKESKQTLTPKLRFPEFRNAAGWELLPLSGLLSQRPKYGVNAPGVPFSEKLPTYLRITDIGDDGRLVGKNRVSVDIDATEDDYLQEGDMVFARTGASVGKSYRYRQDDGKLVFAGFLIRIRPDTEKLVTAFLSNYVSTRPYWEWVAATSARSGQPGINGTEYESLPVPVPQADDLKEQTKIAECLCSLDELIAAQGQKVEALKAHKNGLMQQLFPREGETVLRLRFPEFRHSIGWKSEPMLKLYSFKRNNSLSRDKLNDESGTVKNVHYGDIHTKFPALLDITKAQVPFINSTEEVPNANSEDYCVEGDLIFADASEDTNDVGKSIEIVFLAGEQMLAGQHTILARRNGDEIILGFGGHLFRSTPIRSQIQRESQGTKVYAISSTRLGNINIPYPADKTEQQKIADSLTSLDELIAAQEQIVAVLKDHKNGLMQQLFPSLGDADK